MIHQYLAPLGVLLGLVVLVALADLLITLLVHDVLVPRWFAEAAWVYVDALLLALVVAPLLYVLVFRGMRRDLAEREQIANELRKYQFHLEEVVMARTDELVRARDAAEAAKHEKIAFVASISHELRIPLNSIIGWNYLLHKEIQDPRQKEQLGKLGSAANHLLRVINNILELSQIESGKSTLEEADFDLARLVESTISMFNEQATDKGLLLTVELDSAIPPLVHADPLRLGQILFNFVSNAIRFSDMGTIKVKVRVVEELAHQLLIRIEVEDQGIGLTREQQANLFHTFQHVEGATSRELGTSGLGLVISSRLVKLMGGEIGVESEYGAGSRFWITASMGKVLGRDPLVEMGRLLLNEAPLQIIARKFAGRRLLVAEDDLFNQEVLLALLADTGLEVDVVENGQQVVEQIQQENYALVLMDVQMPVMDGLSATRIVRQLPSRAGIPILAFTANAMEEDRKLCMEAGMSDYLSKPVDPDRLYAVLLHWLHKSAETK